METISKRIQRHYLPLIILILLIGLVLYFVWPKLDAITYVTDSTGYISLILILISLVLGSINLISRRKNPISSYYRRDISILGGLLAIIHSLCGLFVHLRGNNWQYFLSKTGNVYSIRLDEFGLANYFGLFSLLLIFLLLLISNDYSVRKLNPKNWKNLQRFSYLMFVLVLIHSIYYMIVMNNAKMIYYIYIPLFLIVLFFQMIGFRIRLVNRKNKQIIEN